MILALSASAIALDLQLESVTSGFLGPLCITHSRDGSGRLFVAEQGGRIRIIDNTGHLLPTDFLNVGATGLNRIIVGSERGLLGLTFHPDYKTNGRFYINYTKIGTGDTIVAEYTVSDDPNVANPDEKIIIGPIFQPAPNHNGGWVEFGPDRLLYIGVGEGGLGALPSDPIGTGQDLNTLLGKILRIDVDNPQPGLNYGIPPDNFFASDGNPNTRGEIFAYGMRNPFRCSFDRGTGRLFAGDVGASRREEVDLIVNGGNYGWRIMEGTECFNVNDPHTPLSSCDETGLILPIDDYDRTVGITVIGGYVYRGTKFPRMQGIYFFADFGPAKFFTLVEDPPGTWTRTTVLTPVMAVSSFGEDEEGELYACDFQHGVIVHLVDGEPPPTPTPTPSPTPSPTPTPELLGVKHFSVFE